MRQAYPTAHFSCCLSRPLQLLGLPWGAWTSRSQLADLRTPSSSDILGSQFCLQGFLPADSTHKGEDRPAHRVTSPTLACSSICCASRMFWPACFTQLEGSCPVPLLRLYAAIHKAQAQGRRATRVALRLPDRVPNCS